MSASCGASLVVVEAARRRILLQRAVFPAPWPIAAALLASVSEAWGNPGAEAVVLRPGLGFLGSGRRGRRRRRRALALGVGVGAGVSVLASMVSGGHGNPS